MTASLVGSLIQATVGSFGGVGRRWPKRAGLVQTDTAVNPGNSGGPPRRSERRGGGFGPGEARRGRGGATAERGHGLLVPPGRGHAGGRAWQPLGPAPVRRPTPQSPGVTDPLEEARPSRRPGARRFEPLDAQATSRPRCATGSTRTTPSSPTSSSTVTRRAGGRSPSAMSSRAKVVCPTVRPVAWLRR